MNSVEFLLAQRKSYFEGTEMILRGIKPEWFGTRPHPEIMSFGEQIDHISAVEAEILDETATALDFDRIPFNFVPSDSLKASIDQWKRIHDLGDGFISSLDDAKLDIRFLTISHVHISVYTMINTVIEHEIHHRGELIAYFRMMNTAPPKRWAD